MNRSADFKIKCKVKENSFKTRSTAPSINSMISSVISVNFRIAANGTRLCLTVNVNS
jgi:hypothetical protein